jgi:hypothetical protein
MNENKNAGRDVKSGRFQSGNIGGPGRKPGSRNRLGEEFLAKFAADVEMHGTGVIERVRVERPEIYLKIWADLLPRKAELDVNLDIDALRETSSALEAFRALLGLLGADPQAGLRHLRKVAPHLEHFEDATTE